ncbi:alpha-galactosidase [Microlunatus soli]|uniref:Alpha-galactosidase n=1 Tax=Microlunatus soli TaxID=630515 RepID=A0A1H1TE21_9ACTN|nr:alpha-galactosidase [Microlunatus soli]SDS58418.1 alpha-galactosidase [Microlunatus soli]
MTDSTDRDGRVWRLPTRGSEYAVSESPDGTGLIMIGWGERSDEQPWKMPWVNYDLEIDAVPTEYSATGTRQTRGAELIVDHGDGLIGARLRLDPAQVTLDTDGPRTILRAVHTDSTGQLRLTSEIETSRDHDVVAKKVIVKNTGSRSLTFPRLFSAGWQLPIGPGARIDYLAGAWAHEFGEQRAVLPSGELSIGSRQGFTSHRYSPVITVAPLDDWDAGSARPSYSIALAWSGSWRMLVDAVPGADRVRVAGGIDDETCVITLEPGESFETPAMLGIRGAAEDSDAMAAQWHRYQRGQLARNQAVDHRPIVYNSWYATEFDVELDHQRRLAGIAAELGAEVFVVDDGWFAGRTSDRAGLGDWTPDPAKFPDGLGPLIDTVTGAGMRFGLWVEPEAVNPDSDLFRAHPDWIYRAGDRPLLTGRNQYVLDLGRPEVLAWVGQMLRDVLADSRISYLKWDLNRPISDGGRPGDDHGRQWSVQHTLGYYALLHLLRTEFPHVTVEACAGGGGRIDNAVLARTDVVWTSDETGPRDRLAIQHGFLGRYPASVMSSWVTDEPDELDHDPASLGFRFAVAMTGVLGVGSDLLGWDSATRSRAAELIATYKEIRGTVHNGDVHRHGTPQDPIYMLEYGDRDRSCLFVFLRPGADRDETVRPRGLDPDARYRRVGGDTVSGADAMAVGLPIRSVLAPDADLIILERQG